jgi:hypothetical protein
VDSTSDNEVADEKFPEFAKKTSEGTITVVSYYWAMMSCNLDVTTVYVCFKATEGDA